AQRRRDARAVVADAARPAQAQTPSCQQFDHLGQVLVGPFARQDFVADDDEAEGPWSCMHVIREWAGGHGLEGSVAVSAAGRAGWPCHATASTMAPCAGMGSPASARPPLDRSRASSASK